MIMSWQEHAKRSVYTSHMGNCRPHVLLPAPLVETEAMMRFSCRDCPGSLWVAWRPSVDQGADPDEFIEFVEGIVNELAETRQAESKTS